MSVWFTPRTIPDYAPVCSYCHKPVMLREWAEQQLVGKVVVSVTRCPLCQRALWYRSNAGVEPSNQVTQLALPLRQAA